MAVYNKQYLKRLEMLTVTEPLTGLRNRMAYKQDLEELAERKPDEFACVFVDVNELHIVNNRFGHVAGDEMLIYIADKLREEFDDSRLYRIGGDEFLVFTEKISEAEIQNRVLRVQKKVEDKNYHISTGVKYCEKGVDPELLMKQAEERMYQEKAEYYRYQRGKGVAKMSERQITYLSTGVPELDACLSIMSRRYLGLYLVSLEEDTAKHLLMSSHFEPMFEGEEAFSSAFIRYIHNMVQPDFRRGLTNVLKYDVMKKQLIEGEQFSMTYTKIDGEKVILSIYLLPAQEEEMKHGAGEQGAERQTAEEQGAATNTLWVFEKAE